MNWMSSICFKIESIINKPPSPIHSLHGAIDTCLRCHLELVLPDSDLLVQI
jgi:hypothetical protein